MTNKQKYSQECFSNFLSKMLAFRCNNINAIKELQYEPDYSEYNLTEINAFKIKANVIWEIQNKGKELLIDGYSI